MWCFFCVVDIESDYKLVLDNYCLCLCIFVFRIFIKGIEVICLENRDIQVQIVVVQCQFVVIFNVYCVRKILYSFFEKGQFYYGVVQD